LIPVEEFLAIHPENADLEEDKLMLARIQHEHDERDAAKNRQMGLLKRKEELTHENSKKKVELEKLDRQIEAFVKGTKVVEDVFQTATKEE
jgi:THO complex subunit 5